MIVALLQVVLFLIYFINLINSSLCLLEAKHFENEIVAFGTLVTRLGTSEGHKLRRAVD